MNRGANAIGWLAYLFLLSIALGCNRSPAKPSIQASGDTQTTATNASTPTISTRDLGRIAEGYGKSVAIVIGIDEYSFKPLERAVRDARSVRDVLIDELGYSPDRVRLLENEQAKRGAIVETLTDWLHGQQLGADDSVLFFFAGHGDPEFLAAADSEQSAIETTWLPIQKVVDRLNDTGCRHKLVILNSCFSGSLFDSRGGAGESDPASSARKTNSTSPSPEEASWEGSLAGYLRKPCFLGITASRDTVAADGLGKDGHSLFTWALLESIKERALTDRTDQVFVGRALANDVERRVFAVRQSSQCVGWGYLQGQDAGDFVFKPTKFRKTPRQISEERRKQLKVRTFVRDLAAAKEAVDQGKADDALQKLASHMKDPELQRRFEGRLLWKVAESGQESMIQNVDQEGWWAMSVSPDGKRLATSNARNVILWDFESRKKIREKPAQQAVFVADGAQLLVVSQDQSEIWDADTGSSVADFSGPTGSQRGNSHELISAFNGEVFAWVQKGGVSVFDGTTLGKLFVIDNSADYFGNVEIAPDASSIAVTTYVWPAFTDVQDRSLAPPKGFVTVYDARGGRKRGMIEVGVLQVSDLAFSADGKRLAVALGGLYEQPSDLKVSQIDVWNVESMTLDQTLTGFRNGQDCVAFSPDGATLAVGGNPDSGDWIVSAPGFTQGAFVAFFDLWSGQEVFRVRAGDASDPPAVSDLQFLASNQGLLVDRYALEFWDARGNWEANRIAVVQAAAAQRSKPPGANRKGYPGRPLALSSSGRWLLMHGKVDYRPASNALLWNLQRNEQVGSVDVGWQPVATISPDESVLFVGSDDGRGRTYSVDSLKQLSSLQDHEHKIHHATFSRDSSILATTGPQDPDGEWYLGVWAANSGQRIGSWEHRGTVDAIALDATGERLATYCGEDGTLRIWRIGDQKLLAQEIAGYQYKMAFSGDGKKLIGGGEYLTIFTIDGTGAKTSIRMLDMIEDLNSWVDALALDPTSSRFAVALRDGRIAVIDANNLGDRQIISGVQGSRLTAITFRGEGELATVNENGIVGIWQLDRAMRP